MDHYPSLLGKLSFKDTKLREGDQIPAQGDILSSVPEGGYLVGLETEGVQRKGYLYKNLSKGALPTYPTALCITNMLNTPISPGVLKLHIC